MKKVLIGVGIGCGVLLLLVVGAVVAGGMFVKSKVEGMAAGAEKMEAQSKELNELDRDFPFEVPPEGTPVKLDQARVEQYLAVRAALAPVLKKYDEKGKQFENKKQEDVSFSDATAALGMTFEMVQELRSAFITELKKQKMSPKEFHATTQAIYSSAFGEGMVEMAKANEQALTESITALEQDLKDESLSAEDRQALEEQLEGARADLEEAKKAVNDAPGAAEINAANAKVLATYKERIAAEANPVLDGLLLSDNDA